MQKNPFEGAWTYRSFYNKPEPVLSFDDIRLAQAQLTLAETGADWLAGKLQFGDPSLFIEMVGVSTYSDGQHSLRMRGTGVANSPTAGWIYDYVATLAAHWPQGDRQVPAIVGTVTRTAYHEQNRRAGETFSFVAVRNAPPMPEIAPLPASVLTHFADKEHRLHHAVWHALRNNWESLPPSIQQAIEALHWKPARPARTSTKRGDIKEPHVRNGSGEDFLFFHRQMVSMFRSLMQHANGSIVTWETIPRPGEAGEEAPPVWSIPGSEALARRFAALKTDDFYWSRMRWWDQQFKDPTHLSTLTLGEFGSLIEFSVHNDMHIRWSAAPRDPKTNAILPLGRPPADTDDRWDDPKYDWLGEFYSSHVNPFFWRLHGWIDDRIDDWFRAHEAAHPNEVMEIILHGTPWFRSDRWVIVGHPWIWPDHLVSHHGHHHGHGSDPDLRKRRIDSLQAVLDIIYNRKPMRMAEAREVPGTDDIPFVSHIFGE